MPEGIKAALAQFMQALSDASPDSEQKLRMGEIRAASYHQGINRAGKESLYSLELADESDGTRRLMSLAPDMEQVLSRGGVLLVDELEKRCTPCSWSISSQNSKVLSLIPIMHSLFLRTIIRNF